MTDGELVRQARSGQSEALAELAHRWAGKVLALCRTQVACPETAADLAQEALLRAVRGLPTLLEPEKFGGWIRGIAKRVCLDWFKAKPRAAIPFSALPHVDDGHEPSAIVSLAASAPANAEETEELNRAIAELPEDCRETLLLYYTGSMTYQELGQLLQVSAATVNARLTRARALLRQRLIVRQESLR
jgi:RNA polymerase sigma factor (sigma-70 family)